MSLFKGSPSCLDISMNSSAPFRRKNYCLAQKRLVGAYMKLTVHGKHRVAERGISEAQILQAVSKPTFSFYDLSSAAYVAFKRLNGKHLLVVYAPEGNEIRVITTFITSSAQEIMDSKLKNGAWVKIK
ncbi:MAG: DUF4258 domain-containing protein [Chloroflexi bacterium]|nr:DUF4258 domain-containing protein [Chloroflexota bacterium]